jgi:hypothetical protein
MNYFIYLHFAIHNLAKFMQFAGQKPFHAINHLLWHLWNHFIKIGQSLNFVQQWCTSSRWELEQLDGNGVAAMAKSDWKE